MFKKLRKRFILISMLSILSVLTIIIAWLNVENFSEMTESADAIIDILLKNDGEFPNSPNDIEQPNELPPDEPPPDELPPNEERPDWQRPSEPPSAGKPKDENDKQPHKPSQDKLGNQNLPPDKSGNLNKEDKPNNGKNKPDRQFDGMPPETPYSSRFFATTVTNGEITYINTYNIAFTTEEEAKEYTLKVHSEGSTRGYCYGFRFGCITDGEKTVYVFLDVTKELISYNKSFFTSIAISFVGLIIVLALVLIFSKRIVKPMSESYEKQKQFITDAGHELKTPITVISAEIDLIEMDYGESEWTGSIREQIERLSTLTDNLITLSKMEEAEKCDFKEFALSNAVSRVSESFEPLMQLKGKVFKAHIQDGISMYGSECAIKRLLTVLLDNAVKYSNENGLIELCLRSSGKKTELTVCNTVTEIETGSHDECFERFYRRDKSRSSEISGSGIGLSVAKAITETHSGKISAESKDGKSFTVRAVLPLK